MLCHTRSHMTGSGPIIYTRALTGLPTHTCGQTHGLNPFALRNTFTGAPRACPCQPTLTQASHAGLIPSSRDPWSLPPLCHPHLGPLPSATLSCFQVPAHLLAGHLLSSGPGKEWAGSSVCQGSWAVATCSRRTRMQKYALFKQKMKKRGS